MIKFFTKQINNKKGFTLIELIVVIAILGILAAIAIPRFSNVTDNAKIKANAAEHRIIVSAVQMYRAASSTLSLPTNLTDLDDYIEGNLESLGTLANDTYTNANGTHKIELTADLATITSTPSVTGESPKVTTVNK